MLLLVLLCFASLFISLLFSSVTAKGSDHYYHNLLINLIRSNNNKFVTKHDNFINENLNSYPQLLHWVFSFFSDASVGKISKYLSLFFQVLINLSFFGFIVLLESNQVLFLSFNEKILSLLTFQLIPFNYNVSNAKNTGLSARGLGLFFGQNFIYSIVLFSVSGSILYLFIAGLMIMLIFLSSQFATQFVLFFSIIVSVLFTDIVYMLPLLGGILVMFILFYNYTKILIKGQLNHKIVYSQHLAERFILKQRPSVWRDIYIELPKQIYYFVTRQIGKEKFGFIDYMLNNSIVIFLFEMPFLFAIFIDGAHFENENLIKLSFIILSTIIIFFITTFKKMRFLGEPERYLEFALPLVVLLLTYALSFSMMIILLLYSFMFVLGYYIYKKLTYKEVNVINADSKEVESVIVKFGEEEGFKIITNSSETGKYFFNTNIKMYFYLVNMRSVDGMKFQDVFTDVYPMLRPEVLPLMIIKYNIPYIFLKNIEKEKYLLELEESEVNIELIYEGENNSLFKRVV